MKYSLTLIAGLLISFAAMAQNRVVHGRLTTFNKYPVKNVEVTSKKAKSTTVSDTMGHFSIVCLDKDIIQIKPKTFKAVTKKVNEETDSLIVNLIFLNSKSNRERAVGYGYIAEEDLNYAVEHLEDQNNDFCSYHNIFDLIRGRFSGVKVTNDAVYIAGNRSFYGDTRALYVLDGVPTENISWIAPCTILTIDILKYGDAAIYGSRGANGVVVIRTKKK
jgi:TonB-dependent SusC/RagA subfamily outer membrane receptor